MSTNHTTNYNLCQWEATDQVLRTDFNEDNAKIDAALATIPQIAIGTYIGNGSASQKISLSFTPKAVFFCSSDGKTYIGTGSGYLWGGLAVSGSALQMSGNSAAAIITGGFMVFQTTISDYSSIACNRSGQTYHYIAFG